MPDKTERFLTTHTMLEWQYYQILGELQELQRHDSDPTCPCRLSDDLGENCLAKHSLGLSVLAAETAAMETDKKNAALLWELSADAKDRHMKIKGFLCHKNDGPEFGDWSRQWRKKIEPIYYHQSCNVKLKDEGAELQDPTTDKVEAQTFGIKLAAAEYSQACPEHASERSFSGIKKEIDKRADSIDKIVEDLMSRPTAMKPCPPAKPCAETPAPKKSAAAVVVPVPSGISTKTFAMGITTPTRYEFTWKIVDAKDLIVSHDPFTFEVNPKFVQALQPRLRDRVATQMQVMNIAAKLEPDLLLQDFLSLDKGSPIVDSGNLVLCGNGRVMGIIRAIKENLDRYVAYKTALKDMAAKYGLTSSQVDRVKSPVLVRELITNVDKKSFAEECNASTVIEASPIEKAKTDAEKITPAMLNSIVVLENESIFDAIKAVRNKDFVISFLNKLPPNEQAGLVDAKGVLSQAGTRRIAMAIFVATFKGNVGLTLATKFFESNDPDVLTVFNGITKALSVLARAEALVQAGQRQPDYAFGEDLAKVVTVYSGIRQTEGMTVAKYINQQAFERQLNPFQEKVLQTIGDNARSGKRIGQILSAFGQLVIDSPPPSQGGLMALEPLTKSDLWDTAVKKALTVDLSDIAVLFDKISDRLRAGAAALQKQIDEKRDPAASHQNLTPKRARETANASNQADHLEETQKAMIGLAAAIDAGTAPTILEKVTNRAQVEQVLHSHYYPPEFHKSNLSDLRKVAEGTMKSALPLLDSLENRVNNSVDQWQVELRTDEIPVIEELVEKSKTFKNEYGYVYSLTYVRDGIQEGKRIIAMGLDSKERFEEAKAALKQYVSGPSPEVLAKKKERELTASLIGQKIPGFFPTPRPVIDEMIDRAMLEPGMSVLEPSAGKGDIADVIKEKCPDCEITLREINMTLVDILRAKGYRNVVPGDFMKYLDYVGPEHNNAIYDRILMNPPFEKAQDVDHVEHAFNLLKPGGRLVAIMGEHCFFADEAKCTQFRNWLDSNNAIVDKLPEGSFSGEGAFVQTGVNARIVVIDKPAIAASLAPTAKPEIIKSCNYGDVCLGPDGKIGIMRGSGGLGSDRVQLKKPNGDFIGYYNRQELKLVPSTKEPWQMTAVAFWESRQNTPFSLDWFDAKFLHKDIVDEAIKAGKPVPQNVLTDPDYVQTPDALELMPIPETPIETGQQIRLFDKKKITTDDVAQLFASRPAPKEQMGFDFDARPYIEPPPFPTATHCPPICPIAPEQPIAQGNIKYTPAPYQQEGYEWLKNKSAALLADEPGVGKTCTSILWGADHRPALVISPANAVINWAQKEIHGMWRPNDSYILLDGKQPFPEKVPDWVVMSYGMLDRYLDNAKKAGFKCIIVDEAHMVKNLSAKRTQHLINLVEPVEYEKLRRAELQGETAEVRRLQKIIPLLKPIPNRLAVTGTPVLNRPIELFALLLFLGMAIKSDYKGFMERYTEHKEVRGRVIWTGAKNLDQLNEFLKPIMLRRFKADVLKDLPPKVNSAMFVPITNAKEYREAETNFLSWLEKTQGAEAADRAVDAQVIVQMNALRKLAAAGKVQPVADWMKPCSMTGSKMLVFSSFTEPLEELNRIKSPLSEIYTGATSKEERQAIVDKFQHDPGLCYFLGTVGAAGVAITLTAANRVAFLDLPWTPGGKVQAEDRAHRRGQTKTVEVYNILAKGTIDERMLELLKQKEEIIAQAVDGKSKDEAMSGSIANSLMQSFISSPNLSDTIEEYEPDKPDEDLNEIEDEILQGYASDSGFYERNSMKALPLDDSKQSPTTMIPAEWSKYTVNLELVRSPDWSNETAPTIRSPQAAQKFFSELRKAEREYCLVICLDTQLHLIGLFELSIGDYDSAMVNPMEVARIAAKTGASSLIVVHNHPSGDPTPSSQDIATFNATKNALALMKVDVVDFMVVGHHQDYSITGNKTIPVQARFEDSIDDIVAQLFDSEYTWLAKRLNKCNLSERDIIQIYGWRPLRNFLSWATSRKEPVQVCSAGITHGIYQVSIIGVEGGRDNDISMHAKSVPGLKKVFTKENNAVFEIVVPEEAEAKPLEWQSQEVNTKPAKKEPANQAAMFDEMTRSDPVDGKTSSIDIPLTCGRQKVDPVIENAINNAKETGE